MICDVDVFGLVVVDGVLCKIDTRLVIAVQLLGNVDVELLEGVSIPFGLSSSRE